MLRWALVSLLGALFIAPAAAAQDLAEAERLFRLGIDSATREDWTHAEEYFSSSRAIVERPSIVCNLGFALYHLERTLEAAEALERCRAVANADGAWAAGHASELSTAIEYLAELESRLSRLSLTLEPSDARATLDGDALETTGGATLVLVEPGRHRLAVSAPGHEPLEETLNFAPRATIDRSVVLSAVGVLVVESLATARILIDGDARGVGRLEAELRAGGHTVRVEADGYAAFEETIELAAGARVSLAPTLARPSSGLVEEPALWIGVGAGVLVVVGAIVLGAVLAQPSDPLASYGGSTGRVLTPLTVAF